MKLEPEAPLAADDLVVTDVPWSLPPHAGVLQRAASDACPGHVSPLVPCSRASSPPQREHAGRLALLAHGVRHVLGFDVVRVTRHARLQHGFHELCLRFAREHHGSMPLDDCFGLADDILLRCCG